MRNLPGELPLDEYTECMCGHAYVGHAPSEGAHPCLLPSAICACRRFVRRPTMCPKRHTRIREATPDGWFFCLLCAHRWSPREDAEREGA